mgnify:FL=1
MRHLATNSTRRPENSNVKTVTYVRAAYRPVSAPEIDFEAEKRTAQVWLGPGETVADVLNYHYPSRHQIIEIH